MRYQSLLLALLGFCALSATVFAEDAADGEVSEETPTPVTSDEEDGEIGASPDAQVAFVFQHPADANIHKELDAGKLVKYLIGFQNKGEKDFILQRAETSFRYPLEWNYHLYNFTAAQFNKRVAPKEEVTVEYTFYAFDQFAGRPLGLVVDLHYVDSEGRVFVNNVFNETVNIVEDESGFNTETGFLYLVFAGFAVLALLAGRHFLDKFTRKTGLQKKRVVVEQGTTNAGEVDYEWIPRNILKQNEKKSPNPSSPKARKSKKAD